MKIKKTNIFEITAVLIAALLLFCACGSGNASSDGASEMTENPSAESSAGGSDNADGGSGAEHEPDGIEALWYYDPARADRYEAYAGAHPELAEEDVVWMVDANLDLEVYEDTQEVTNPDDIYVLVNKYFNLPADYVPADLVSVGSTLMHPEAALAMQAMIDDAAAEGHTLWSQSGYRSYDLQSSLYSQYSARDGSELADTYSARPGHSEHQTGLATDLNTITDAFGATPEGQWAAENCWKYGFIVRYTEENTGITHYKSEPWHMRYIGLEAATAMRDLGISSYEEYWVKYIRYAPGAVG